MRKSTKIVLASLLAAVSALSLCSCASTSNTSTNDTTTTQTTAETIAETTAQETATTSSDDSSSSSSRLISSNVTIEESEVETAAQSSADDGKTYANLAEYYNTSEMQETIKESEETLKNEVYSAKILCEDNTLVYQYTYANTYTGDTKDSMSKNFAETLESLSEAFESIADNLNSIITEPCTVKCRYLNGDGTTLYEKEFS